jgi:Domain of unknown function (DUF929)
MSQAAPGGKPGQRPGSAAGRGQQGKRPPASGPPKKRTPATSGAPGKGRPSGGPGAKGRPPGAAGGGAKGRGPRPNTVVSARPPQRFSSSTIAFVSIAVVVVIVVVFVVIKVSGGSSSPSKNLVLSLPSPAPTSLVSKVTGVPASVTNAVGVGSGVNAPSVLTGQKALVANGKPEVLFIGAEFCPLCAAERWAIVEAFSRFGTWSGLDETTSSPWDSYPDTATFSFRNATLTSPYVTLVMVEHETNDNHGQGTRALFQPLTTAQTNLWTTYSSKLGISNPGYPFVDFGNKVFVTGPSYDPQVLFGLTQQEIAARLTKPTDPVTEGIIGTANYLTAAICSLTKNQPSSVCSASGVKRAASSLKLG